MAERTQRPSDRAVFVISVAAELVGVHPQTLRIYEREGLVHPKRTNAPGQGPGSRRYSERDIQRLREIQELTRKGVNLAGVRRVIELQKQIDRLSARVAELEADLALQARRHHQQLDEVRRATRRELALPHWSSAAIV